MIRTARSRLLTGSLLLLPMMAIAMEPPRTGETMDQVRRALGAPAHELDSVGSPAITRWVYDGLTVYFENRQVLHAVRTQPLPERPASPAVSAAAPVTAGPAPVKPAPAPVAPTASAPAPREMPAPEPTPATPPPPPAPESKPAPSPALAPSTPAQAQAPAPATATPSASPRIGGTGFYFDPETGRLILDEEKPAAPAQAPASPTPAGTGDALSPSLTFDPETGTFR